MWCSWAEYLCGSVLTAICPSEPVLTGPSFSFLFHLFRKMTFWDLWNGFFRGQMPSPSDNTQCQSAEGKPKNWPQPLAWLHPCCVRHCTSDGKGITGFPTLNLHPYYRVLDIVITYVVSTHWVEIQYRLQLFDLIPTWAPGHNAVLIHLLILALLCLLVYLASPRTSFFYLFFLTSLLRPAPFPGRRL